MSQIDFILNLAGLLLWIGWRSYGFDALAQAGATSLAGTLRKAEPAGGKRWVFPAGLAALLLLRAVIYWEFGPGVDWTPRLRLGVIAPSFRSDYLGRMLLYSVLSFALALTVFYLSLLLVSVANRGVPDSDPFQRLLRLHIGWVDRWPGVVKLLLPVIGVGLLWAAAHPALVRLEVVPPSRNFAQLAEEAALIGLGSYLAWRYLIAIVMVLHLMNSYLYLGNHPFWKFINVTAGNLLMPLRRAPLRIGKVDFAPIAAIALVYLGAEFAGRWLTALYERLPL
jgi:uncharacterized protein YggT (Ycf19 family)